MAFVELSTVFNFYHIISLLFHMSSRAATLPSRGSYRVFLKLLSSTSYFLLLVSVFFRKNICFGCNSPFTPRSCFSLGTVALCSLLTGSVISRFYAPSVAATVLGADSPLLQVNATTPGEPVEIDLPNDVKYAIASSLCLLVGLVQVSGSYLT